MLKKERQLYILDKLKEQGKVTTNEMVEEIGYSVDTIRKDFQEMSRLGQAKRIHGGIVPIEQNKNSQKNELLDFNERLGENVSVKELLAQKAVELLGDPNVIYIDGGTTNLQFVRNLPYDIKTTVITNSPAIALALCNYPNIEIQLLGGTLQKTIQIVEGIGTLEQMKGMHFQVSVIGVSSLSAEGGITFPSMDEVILKKEALNHSQLVIAIADKSKLNSIAGFYATDISAISILVTDETDEAVLAPYRQAGVEVISCSE